MKPSVASDEREHETFDLIAVGAGFAGLMASVRAQALGARVAVVEHSAVAPSWSNSRLAGGSLVAAMGSIDDPPAAIAARLQRAMGEPGDDALVRNWAEACSRVYHWLRANGTRFVRLYGGLVIAPVRPNRIGQHWSGRGTDVLLRRLYGRVLAGGGAYFGHTAARELILADGRVRGLIVERLDPPARLELKTRAVVLADGGFQGNPALLRKYANIARPERVFTRGAGSGVGSGLEMALAAGAQLDPTEAVFAHLLHVEAFTNPQLAHFPFFDRLAVSAIVVGPDGQRFVDEQRGPLAIANRIARLPDPASAWVVFDRERWETVARTYQAIPPNPHIPLAHARLEMADTPAALAARMGVPVAALATTIDNLNEAIATGQPSGLPVPRGGTPAPLQPPFMAAPLAVGLTYTMGGPLIDAHARVVDTAGTPILGLYAAGTTAGGLGGGPKPVSAGGLGVALPLGFMAGEHAAGAGPGHQTR
jgi:fumarate reductase flavoprotein subunit